MGGGVLTAYSVLAEGKIAEAEGKFQQKIAERNQRALERQAKAEREAAKFEEKRVTRKEKIVSAAQRAIIGKSGIGLAGATLSVLADTAFQFSLERNWILRGGLIRARELIERGGIIAAQGKWAKILGREAKKLSYFKAAASILGSAGQTGFLSQPGQVRTYDTSGYGSYGSYTGRQQRATSSYYGTGTLRA